MLAGGAAHRVTFAIGAEEASMTVEIDKLNQDVFTTSRGAAVLQWPNDIPPGELALFEAWLDLVKQKIHLVVTAAQLPYV